MDEDKFYIYLKSNLKSKLIKNLKKDEYFINLNIEDLIEERVNKILDGDMDLSEIKINEHKYRKNDMSEQHIIKEYMKLNRNIKFQEENPKSKGTDVYDRYERYKRATNYNEFKEFGGKNEDYYNDYRKEYLKILD